MSIIALFATANTVLIILIVMSRMLYGVSREHSMPKCLGNVGKSGTPYISVFIVMLFSIVALFIGELGTIARLTTLGILILFSVINLSLIFLRYREPKTKRPFKLPVNIGRFPVIALLGLLSCLWLIFYIAIDLGFNMLIFEAFIIIAGVALYKLFNQ